MAESGANASSEVVGLAAYDVEELADFVIENAVPPEVVSNFEKNLVTGKSFLKLSEEDLKELVPMLGLRTEIRDILKKEKDKALGGMSCDVSLGVIARNEITNTTESSGDINGDVRRMSQNFSSSCSSIAGSSSRAGSSGSLVWHTSFEIPDFHNYSETVKKAIETGAVSSKARRDIIQTLRTLILQHTRNMTSEQYATVSRKLIAKYPKLRDDAKFGSNGYGSWKESLRTAFKNFRRDHPVIESSAGKRGAGKSAGEPPSKRLNLITPEPDDDCCQEFLTELADEMKKGKNGNQASMKTLMSKTQQWRRNWIVTNRPLISEILEKFPLTNSRMIRKEFRSIVLLDDKVITLKSKWPMWMEKLLGLAKIESTSRPALKKLIDNMESATDTENIDDHSNYIAIEVLMKLLYPRGPGKDSILAKYIPTCDIDIDEEVKKIKQKAPFIFVCGEPGEETTQYFVCGEKNVICESKSYLDAVLDLICTYYVFDIIYPKALSGVLLFFQQSVFELQDDQTPPLCLVKLLKNISSLSD